MENKYIAKTSIKKIFTLLLLVIVVIGGIVAYSMYNNYREYIEEPLYDEDERITIEIEPGSSTEEVHQELKENNLEINKQYYNMYLRQNPELASGIEAGRFVLNKNMSLKEVIQELQEAGVVNIRATFPEGITYKQMSDILEDEFFVAYESNFSSKEFENIVENPNQYTFDQDIEEFLEINKPQNNSLEGFLYPATYEFDPEVKTKDIVSRLVREFMNRIENLQQSQTNRTLYQNLILASIVEKESYTDEEKPLVASVFHNRLKIGMKLESDATINYVTGENRPRPTYDDLQVQSPYNTYQNVGLPPTPINNPRFESIAAAVSPEPSDYHYFIHEQNESRQVHFAKTHDGHLENVKKYLD